MVITKISKTVQKSDAPAKQEYTETVLERKTRGRPRAPTPEPKEPQPEPQGDEAIKMLPKGYYKGYPPAITATEPEKADAIIKRYPKSAAQIKAFQDKVLTPRQEQMKERIKQREITAAKALIEKYGDVLGLNYETPAPTPAPETPARTPTPIIVKKVKAQRKPRTIIVEEEETESEDVEVVRRRKPRRPAISQSESEPEQYTNQREGLDQRYNQQYPQYQQHQPVGSMIPLVGVSQYRHPKPIYGGFQPIGKPGSYFVD